MLGRVKVGQDDATLLLVTRDSVTVSPWSIVPRCLRVLLVLQTMSDSWIPSVPSLAVPAIRHCWKHLQNPGTAWNDAPWGHCPKEQSCIVWTDLYGDCHFCADWTGS